MSDDRELSFYEYWLSKEVWSAAQAVNFIACYYNMHRTWNKHEDTNNFFNGFVNELTNKLSEENNKNIFTKRTIILSGYDGDNKFVQNKLDIYQSDVKLREYLIWLHNNGYNMPYEFKTFIEVENKECPMTKKLEDRIAKEVVQGIGKTLWDIYPAMTIEEMLDNKAIKIYAGGKFYERDTTVRKWLSEVDSRKIKTGPKKSK